MKRKIIYYPGVGKRGIDVSNYINLNKINFRIDRMRDRSYECGARSEECAKRNALKFRLLFYLGVFKKHS